MCMCLCMYIYIHIFVDTIPYAFLVYTGAEKGRFTVVGMENI